MRALVLVSALAIVACANNKAETKEEPKALATTTPTHSDAPTGRGELMAGALAHLIQPPKEEGKHVFEVDGCAKTPEVEPPPTRGGLPAEDKVEASALGGGVLLSHEVGHACCLSAASAVALDGNKVVITETLSGTPCRCRCSSNLRTSVGLKPGTWQVELKTVSPGKTWTAWTGELKVKALAP